MKAHLSTIFNVKKSALRCSAFALTALLAPVLVSGTADPVGSTFSAQAGQKVKKVSNNDQVKLGLNKSVVIDLPTDAYDILVANPTVADAVTRTARRIYIFGKAVGTTNVFVFGPNGEQIASIDLTVERDVAGLDSYLSRFIEDSDITAEIINDNIVLTGTVQTPQDAAKAVALAEIFVKGGEATTGAFDKSSSAGEGAVVIGGNNQEARRSSSIVNLLKIVGDDQVTLKVTVAEISRTVMKQLGVSHMLNNDNGVNFAGLSESVTGLGKDLAGSGLGVASSFAGNKLTSYLNAMEQTGVMKTLAEPTLTAVSGEKATFRVGGEYNLITEAEHRVDDPATPENEAESTYQVGKVDYGIGLEFTPVVLSPGRISLKVRTSVSEPTTDGGLNLGPTGIISIRKRLADTTIELPSGGSMMIAGLVRDDVRQVISGMPGLKNVPVLGSLFRSRDFVRSQSELVIIVTPYLARPVARNKLAKPDDNFTPASDGAGVFLGKVNRVYGTMQTNRKSGQYHGVVGFIYK
ncbi:MAG: type II and III secretion system protein family protein [Rhizobiaceae bacterium]